MARAPLVYGVKLNVEKLADDLDKAITNLRAAALRGNIANTAQSSHGERPVPLFPLLDNGIAEHQIDVSDSGYLANEEKGFIVRNMVNSPAHAPLNISQRTAAFLEAKIGSRFFGASTRALVNRRGETISGNLIRETLQDVLLQAKSFAESITPSNWESVKQSYVVTVNGKKIDDPTDAT